jgi:hypothetical protein
MNNIISSVHFDATGTLEGLQGCIENALKDNPSSLMVLIAEASDIALEKLPRLFSKQEKPVVGLVVPRLIIERQVLAKGVLVFGNKPVIVSHVFTQIDRTEDELQAELRGQLEGMTNTHSAILVIDGTSRGLDCFIHCVHDSLGPDITVAGFGVGYSDFVRRPSIITSSGLLENAALLIFFPKSLCVEVSHGWKKLAGPFLVTHANGNLIHSINYRPALDFYRDVIEQLTGKVISLDDFYQQSSLFPFGMEQFEGEFLVRDPILHDGTAIECTGMVPSNAMVYILQGDMNELCEAAGDATAKLAGNLSPYYESHDSLHVLVIDCISRLMLMGKDYDKELSIIRSQLPAKAKMIGLLSLGELASSSQGLVQLLNKTTVLVGLGK